MLLGVVFFLHVARDPAESWHFAYLRRIYGAFDLRLGDRSQSLYPFGVVAKPHTPAPYYPPAPYNDRSVHARPIRAYRQVRGYTCGFASTLTVLHAFQRGIRPEDLYRRLGTTSDGTRQSAIIRELRSAGLSANPRYDMDLATLQRTLDAGKLVIGYHHRVEHWVVIYGYGTGPDRVFIADPVVEWRSEHTWAHYGPKLQGFGIVCSWGRPRAKSIALGTLPPPVA